MSMENNEKYIANSWIDDGTQEGFKKSFLESLLNQWQGEGNGFNADKLDGKHYCQIINDMDEKIEGLLPAFQIGNVHINRDTIDANNKILKIGFDGVQLNVPNEDGYDNYKRLPWDDEGSVRTEIPDLLDVFEELYEKVEEKLDEEIFNNYRDELNPVIEELTDFHDTVKEDLIYDENGNYLGINAQKVNGISLYVRTPAQYQAMVDDPTYQTFLEDPSNLFIISDEAKPFTDEILAQQPDTIPISQYYEFQIDERTIYNEDGSVETQKVLQYRHPNGEWHDMCLAADLIDDSQVSNQLITLINNSPNITINQDSFMSSFKNIDVNDASDYPFVNYIRDTGISGGVSPAYIGEGNFIDVNQPGGKGNKRYLNLDNFGQKIENKTNNVINQKVHEINATINTLNGRVNELNRLINQNNTEASHSINIINNNISALESSIASVKNTVNNKAGKNGWKKAELATYDSQCLYGYVNEDLHIAIGSIDDIYEYNVNKQKMKWVKTREKVVKAYKPKFTVFFSASPVAVGKIDTDGYVWGRTDYSISTTVSLRGTCWWIY